jgi:N-acylneuraminate cytidylyltransferase
MSLIAIIPARGGSKRIPRKNVKDFFGVPIISHTIKALFESEFFSRVIVSTDDAEISEISLGAGAEIQTRKSELADDYSTTIDVMASVVAELSNSNGVNNDIFTCIYPITPVFYPHYFAEALRVLKSTEFDYVFTAKEFQSSPARSFARGADGNCEMYFPEHVSSRTQDLPSYYHDAALFYLGRAQAWIEKKPILNGNSSFVEIGKYENLDVDDLEDWNMMLSLYQNRIGKLT